ncbi:MAG TPA: nucleoside deaminase [Gemmataceae bacterium]|nr:nucleoside deaminase [Gemmataceae bacterium]
MQTEKHRAALNRRHLLIGASAGAAMPLGWTLPPKQVEARTARQPATREDERLMRVAIAEAARGDLPFGAVIARGGQVLMKERNRGKEQRDPTAHAEMVAIRRFLATYGPEKLRGTTIYASGEPCCMCMGAIVWCGITRVVFGASVQQIGRKMGQIMITSADVAGKTTFETIDITGGVLAPEAMALFK